MTRTAWCICSAVRDPSELGMARVTVGKVRAYEARRQGLFNQMLVRPLRHHRVLCSAFTTSREDR